MLLILLVFLSFEQACAARVTPAEELPVPPRVQDIVDGKPSGCFSCFSAARPLSPPPQHGYWGNQIRQYVAREPEAEQKKFEAQARAFMALEMCDWGMVLRTLSTLPAEKRYEFLEEIIPLYKPIYYAGAARRAARRTVPREIIRIYCEKGGEAYCLRRGAIEKLPLPPAPIRTAAAAPAAEPDLGSPDTTDAVIVSP